MSFTPAFTDKDRALRPRLFILAGVPGCGKTTWARNFFKDYQRQSTDEIREELWPGEPYDGERNATVFRTFHERLDDMLYKGMDAVADATNLSWMEREKLVAIAAEHRAETHLIFFKNLTQAVTRNSERLGNARVPDDAIHHMLNKFTATACAIVDEKYTSITTIEDIE